MESSEYLSEILSNYRWRSRSGDLVLGVPHKLLNARYGLADIARHVIGCPLIRCMRVRSVSHDIAGNIRQTLPHHRMPFVSGHGGS